MCLQAAKGSGFVHLLCLASSLGSTARPPTTQYRWWLGPRHPSGGVCVCVCVYSLSLSTHSHTNMLISLHTDTHQTERVCPFDRELLAIYLAIKRFCYFIEGRQFHVLTDHKPLTFALAGRPDHYSPRQARHLEFIAQFTTDIRHVKGTQNAVADALSRLNAVHTPDPTTVVDFVALAAAQVDDPDLPRLRSDSSLQLQECPLAFSDYEMTTQNYRWQILA